MSDRTKHFVRVQNIHSSSLIEYLDAGFYEYGHLSNDLSNGTTLYSIMLDQEEATALRLRFPVVGFLNFDRLFKKPIEQNPDNIVK